MDFSNLTDEQLKALGFDQIIARDNAQAILNAVLAELQRRAAGK
jgi:hypothetical protein